MSVQTLIYTDDLVKGREVAAKIRAKKEKVFLRSLSGWLGEVENASAVVIIGEGRNADILKERYGSIVKSEGDVEADMTKDPGLHPDDQVRRLAAQHTQIPVEPPADAAAAVGRSKIEEAVNGNEVEKLVEQSQKASTVDPKAVKGAEKAQEDAEKARLETIQESAANATKPAETAKADEKPAETAKK